MNRIKLIAPAKQDTNKAETLLGLGDKYEYNISDNTLIYWYEALDVSEEIEDHKLIGKGFK